MAGNSIDVQEYFDSYLPSLIEKRLAEKPVPEMEGTTSSMQLTIEGERTLVYGITIKDAKEITVTPGGIENPMFSIHITEEFIKPIVDLVSSFVSRKQYDTMKSTKGAMDLNVGMIGDWIMPIAVRFNGAESPKMTLSGPSADLLKIASGELSGPTAFMQGKIKIDGDLAFGMSLANLFM